MAGGLAIYSKLYLSQISSRMTSKEAPLPCVAPGKACHGDCTRHIITRYGSLAALGASTVWAGRMGVFCTPSDNAVSWANWSERGQTEGPGSDFGTN